jgi:hypothetical protein
VANQIHDGKLFVKTNSSDAIVSYTFTNTVAIAINGTTDYGGAVYTVVSEDVPNSARITDKCCSFRIDVGR